MTQTGKWKQVCCNSLLHLLSDYSASSLFQTKMINGKFNCIFYLLIQLKLTVLIMMNNFYYWSNITINMLHCLKPKGFW